MSSKRYRPWNPDQMVLFPQAMRDELEEGHLVPMMKRVRHNTGRSPNKLSADAGYMSEGNVGFCESHGIDAYLAVGRDNHGRGGQKEPPRQEEKVWRAMREKLSSEPGRRIYSRRKVIAEPVFGQAKEARHFRRFSLRGLRKVRREWTFVCLCSNLLKLVNVPPPLQGEPA